jgi:hypothetical protein
MKALNTLVAGLFLAMLAASGCATLNTAATEQEEIVTQIQKEQVSSPIPEQAGTWLDANGWENEAMNDGD